MYKAARKLTFRPQMGVVQLELELGARTQSFTVSPVQASIIQFFADQPQWPLQALAERMKLPAELLRKKLLYWVTAGVLHELQKDTYQVSEGATAGSAAAAAAAVAVEEEEKPASGENKDEIWDMVKMFVIGMLTNQGPQTAANIQTMLTICGLPFNKSQQELVQYLNSQVKEDVFENQGGTYSMKNT